MNLNVRFYDWKTPFNGLPVERINEMLEREYGRGAQIILVSRDAPSWRVEMMEPWGGTLEEAIAHYTEHYEQRDRDAEAAALAAQEPTSEERIAAAMEYQNLMSM